MKFIIALLVSIIAIQFAFAKDVKPVKPVKKEVHHDKVKVDKALTDAEQAEVKAWVDGKVKSGDMTSKQGESALKHAASLKKVMDSEKKSKKGASHGS